MQRKLVRFATTLLTLAMVGMSGSALANTFGPESIERADRVEHFAPIELETAASSTTPTELDAAAPEVLESVVELGTCQQDCFSEYRACVKTGACSCEADYDMCLASC